MLESTQKATPPSEDVVERYIKDLLKKSGYFQIFLVTKITGKAVKQPYMPNAGGVTLPVATFWGWNLGSGSIDVYFPQWLVDMNREVFDFVDIHHNILIDGWHDDKDYRTEGGYSIRMAGRYLKLR